MRLHVLFPSAKDFWVELVRKRKAPDHPLYGLNHLSGLGIKVTWTDKGFEKRGWRLPFRFFDQLFLTQTYMGFKLDVVLSQLKNINQAEVVLTLSESVGLPTLLCKKLGLITVPVVFASIGFDQRFVRRDSLLRQFVTGLLRQASTIIVYSRSEQDVYHSTFGVSRDNIRVISIGVDTTFLAPKNSEKTIDVLAAGRDYARDFKTLIEAVRGTSLTTVLVCPKEHLFGITLPKNVEHREQVSYRVMRDLFARAKLVVVTVHPYKTSGQFGLLEAWAMRKAVIVSDVPTLSTAFAAKNEKHYMLVPPHNAQELRATIERVLSDSKLKARLETSGRALVVKNYQSKQYADQLANVMKEVVSGY